MSKYLSRKVTTTGNLEERIQRASTRKARKLELQGFTFVWRILADELLEKIGYKITGNKRPVELATVLIYDKNEPIYLVYKKMPG